MGKINSANHLKNLIMPFEINHHSNPHSYVKRLGRSKAGESSFKAKQLGRELLWGGFHDGPATTEGTVGSIIIGFIPIVGQFADIRDTVAAIKDLIESPDAAAAIGVGVALLCFIPGADILVRAKRLQKANIIRKANGATRVKTSYTAALKKTYNDSKKAGKRFFKQDRKSHLATGRELRARRPGLMKAMNTISEQVGLGKMDTLEHAWLKQRYFQVTSKHWIRRVFPEDTWINKRLRMHANAGWNLYPMPRGLNSKLGQKPLLSMFVNGAVYHIAAQEVIFTINALREAYEDI